MNEPSLFCSLKGECRRARSLWSLPGVAAPVMWTQRVEVESRAVDLDALLTADHPARTPRRRAFGRVTSSLNCTPGRRPRCTRSDTNSPRTRGLVRSNAPTWSARARRRRTAMRWPPSTMRLLVLPRPTARRGPFWVCARRRKGRAVSVHHGCQHPHRGVAFWTCPAGIARSADNL